MTSPQELIDYAESIIAREEATLSSVEIRTAVSRAFYGALHACLQYEASLSYVGFESPRAGGTHEKLIQRLGNPDPRNADRVKWQCRRLSALLRQLREERERADYKIDVEYSFAQAKTAVIEARKIIDLTKDK